MDNIKKRKRKRIAGRPDERLATNRQSVKLAASTYSGILPADYYHITVSGFEASGTPTLTYTINSIDHE